MKTDINTIVELLNEATLADRDAMDALTRVRVDCNKRLRDHASIQVSADLDEPTIGIVGLINGLFPGQARVAAQRKETDGKLIGFQIAQF